MSLKTIQSKVGLNPDGIFGVNTAKAIQKHFGLGPIHAAHFLAQCGHETGHWRMFEENLNYSKEALLRVFGKYFDEESAEKFQKKPQEIANIVYGNRMGNTDPNDGWKYRGRGAIQLTGKSNYIAFSQYISNPEIVTNPDLAEDQYALESAKFYFDKNNVWRHCIGIDNTSIQRVSQAVNGGLNGLKEREELTKKYYQWITG
jgi:putative chitinase